MPIVLDVDHRNFEVTAIAIGPITFEDVKNHLLMERYFNGLAYKELVDARGSGISWTQSETREIVQLLRELGHGSKLGPTAVLVSDDVAFGIIRMLEALVEDVCEIVPFRDENEARTWLNFR